MAFSVSQLLANEEDLPLDLRRAIAQGRLEEAGRMLVLLFGLSCADATELVQPDVCRQPS